MRPAESAPDSATRARERAELRDFGLFVMAVVVIGNVALWIAVAFRPVPPCAPVVEPSLPAVLLGALFSARASIPDAPSAAAAPSVAPAATSIAPEHPHVPTRPTTSPSRPSSLGELVNPRGELEKKP